MTSTLVPDVRVRGKTPSASEPRQAVEFLRDHILLAAEPRVGRIDGGLQSSGRCGRIGQRRQERPDDRATEAGGEQVADGGDDTLVVWTVDPLRGGGALR
uniref:Uncharacterized protein n=1 Tax=Neobacillus citreus TaxID=2833578 RepID=A0A942T004_9BACI